jgi:sugar phosphate permease
MSFVAVGVFTLALAVLVYLFVRNRPADMGWPSPAGQPQSAATPIGLLAGVRKVLTHGGFWPLAVWFFFDCGIFFSFGGLWGGPYLAHVYGLDKTEAARILSMVAVGMIVGSPTLSWASNSLLRGRKPVIILSSFVTLVITALLAFQTDGISRIGLYLICLGLGIFSSAVVVIAFTANKELFPVQMAGTATGIVNLFPFAGGAVFQPLLGYVLEHYGRVGPSFTLMGYQRAFQVLFFSGLITFIASIFVKETLKTE